MEPKRSQGKRAIADILAGAALGLALGVVAAVSELRGKRGAAVKSEHAQTLADVPPGADSQESDIDDSRQPYSAPPTPELRPGWQRLERHTLPRPTYWPAAMAFGITLLMWGIVTSLLISGVGLALFALALAGWIGELIHGH